MKYSASQKKKVAKLDLSLFERYGNQGWWPTTSVPGASPVYHPGEEGKEVTDREAYEIIVGSILTQNTSWANAEKAIIALSAQNLLNMDSIAQCDGCLETAIIPARYFNQKAARLRTISAHIIHTGGIRALCAFSTNDLRKLLLSWKGIGPETADCILCYAFSRPVFPVDAYTKRLFRKLGLPSDSYHEMQELVHIAISPSAAGYGDFHARIVKLFALRESDAFTI